MNSYVNEGASCNYTTKRFLTFLDPWSKTNDQVAKAMMNKLGKDIKKDADGKEIESGNPNTTKKVRRSAQEISADPHLDQIIIRNKNPHFGVDPQGISYLGGHKNTF